MPHAIFVEDHLPIPHHCQVGVSVALRRVSLPWRQEEATGSETSAKRNGVEAVFSRWMWSIQGCLKKGMIDGDCSFFELFIR